MNRSRFRWWLLSLLLLAFLLRAWNLGGKSLWLDEAFSDWNAGRTTAEIWNETRDQHPPFYYLLLHQWTALGRHESWLRLPSVFASMLSLALTFALGRKLFGKQTAGTAVALLAVAPLSVWYAQEARVVAFVSPVALLIALSLAKGGWQGGALLFGWLALGLYFDYTIVPLWIILSSLWLLGWWRNGRPQKQLALWLGGSLAGWLAFRPFWPHLGLVVGRLGNIYLFANIRELLGLPELGGLIYLLGLLGLGAATFTAGWLWGKLEERRSLYRPVTILIVGGFVMLTVLTPLPRLYSLKRVVATGWPLVVIVVALLIGRLGTISRRVRISAFALSLAAALISLGLIPKDDWRGAVYYINQHSAPSDVVWLASASVQIPYTYYQPKIPPTVGQDMLLDPPQVDIWHIAERQPGTPIPNGPVETWLDENRPLLETISFYRLEVRRYGAVQPVQPPGGG